MQLTAVFESWHIGDGNYPPLNVGKKVNLSFEMETERLELAKVGQQETLTHLGNAEYQFCGEILRIYDTEGSQHLIVIKALDFCFYLESADLTDIPLKTGTRVFGQGTLLLDYYIWVEFLKNYPNPPNLFYNLKVTRIRKVNTPEKYIDRGEKGTSYPTRLSPKDYTDADVEEIETMEGQPFTTEFYLVDFDSKGVEKEKIRRTFF